MTIPMYTPTDPSGELIVVNSERDKKRFEEIIAFAEKRVDTVMAQPHRGSDWSPKQLAIAVYMQAQMDAVVAR